MKKRLNKHFIVILCKKLNRIQTELVFHQICRLKCGFRRACERIPMVIWAQLFKSRLS